jgi:ubiquinol-cytochrome c reductase cytochrome b subunit
MTTSQRTEAAPTAGEQTKAQKLGDFGANWLDERTSISYAVRALGRKIFPDHWSFMLGEIALWSFVILILTGIFLTFFFVPSMEEVVYDGVHEASQGLTMSAAYESTLRISFDVRGGLLIRQMHHWAALIFVMSIMVHMFRVFFTGAFRRPRELNWLIGFSLFAFSLVAGFTGYSLPDDVLSGNGLRVVDGLVKAMPIIGSYLSLYIFGGEFPGHDIIPRLFTVHILLVPALLLALIALHMTLMVVNKHTQYPGPGRTNENVVGVPLFPTFAFKAIGYFFMISGVIALLGATTTINAIWNYGPYDPSPVSAGSQPDWYMLWTDGIVRLMPGQPELVLFGYTLSLNILVPVVIIMLVLGFLALFPWIEQWVTGDRREHHIADRGFDNPVRTALGVAWIVVFLIMTLAATNDIIALKFHLSINGITWFLRFAFFIAPVVAFLVTKQWCLSLQRRERNIALHGVETGRIIRMPSGEIREIESPVSVYDRWVMVQREEHRPLSPGKGVSRLRSWATRFFFTDRYEPVTQTELAAALEHLEHEHREIDAVVSQQGHVEPHPGSHPRVGAGQH